MEKRPLGATGIEVSMLGFGASPLGGVFGPVAQEEATRAVYAALDLGINLFDTAPFYGATKSESVLGEALVGIPRERFVLATKVGRYGAANFDFSADRVMLSIEESLQRLRVDTIDIMTCHDIEFVPIDQVVNEAIPALHRARDQGKIRFVGVSGLPLRIYREALDHTSLDTILSYCHHTLNDDSLLDLIPYLQAKQVGIINASPFAMGLLTGAPPPEWHPAPESLKAACRRAAEHCRARGAELAPLALRFAVSNPSIATTLVGMRSQQEVEQNVAWLQQPQDTALQAEVLEILRPVHNVSWPSGNSERARG